MLRLPAGTTFKMTWINSDTAPDAAPSASLTSSGTLVSSATMTDSGGNHYYAYITLPTSAGIYTARTDTTISSYNFTTRELVQAMNLEDDA